MKLHFTPVTDPTAWNEHLRLCGFSSLWQSWGFGEAMHHCEGWRPHREVFFSPGGAPLGVLQTLVRTRKRILTVARIFNGPLFFEPDPDEATQMSAIRACVARWDKRGCITYISPHQLHQRPDPAYSAIGLLLTGAPAWSSFRIDLERDSASLRKDFSENWRRCLKKAESSGLEISIDAERISFDTFFEPWAVESVRRNYSYPPPDLVQSLWQAAEITSSGSVMLARKEGLFVGGAVNLHFGNVLFNLLVWSSPEGRGLNVNHLIPWRTLLFAQQASFRWHDLGGANEKNNPGFTSFKRGMRGEEYSLAPEYLAKPTSPFLRSFAHLVGFYRTHVRPVIKRLKTR